MNTTTTSIYINADRQSVWRALTKPELVKQWQYGSDVATDWKIGSPIRFKSVWEGQIFKQWGTITEVKPNELIKYSMFAPRPDLEDKPENYFTMIYKLEDTQGGTKLTVTQEDPRPQVGEQGGDEDGNGVLDGLKALVEGAK